MKENQLIEKNHLPVIGILVPVYNEAQNLYPLFNEIRKILVNDLPQLSWFVLFVDDGSEDDSWAIISDLKEEHPTRVKGIRLTKNFGKESALTAGMDCLQDVDVSITLDADFQHPPALITEFIKKWENGAKFVVGIRRTIEGYSLIKRIGSKLFYLIMGKISSLELAENTTDYRLLDKSILAEITKLRESKRIFRGLVNWLGFKADTILFDAPSRADASTPNYSIGKLFNLAVDSIISFSVKPLMVTALIGVSVAVLSLLLIGFMGITDILNVLNYTPMAYFVVFNTVLMGLVLSSIGIIAVYVGHMHTQLLGRPLYIIREKI